MSSSNPPNSRLMSIMIGVYLPGLKNKTRPTHVGRSCLDPPQEDLMATFARSVDVEWNGNLMEGKGTATAGTRAFSVPVTFPSRIAEKDGGTTTPEEFMAAAHAVC